MTTSQRWAELKRALIRDRGRPGAAAWMEHAARVMAVEAKRTAVPIEQERSL